MKSRIALVLVAAVGIYAAFALATEAGVAKDVQEGHHLAIIVCANCHVAASDQPYEPILRPPAPSFESIAQRSDINAVALQKYLSTLHRNVSHPEDMPNPQLVDDQIKQVVAYLLSLRKQP
jgi:mono/diheme cytochrome c family protein